MDSNTIPAPVLESRTGEQWPVALSCSIGRSPSNQIVFSGTKVSRRHAIVHSQGNNEFWLVDLGSSNGTCLNGRRVSQPTRLKNRDEISIGDFVLTFRMPEPVNAEGNSQTLTEATLHDVKTASCWLLLVDMVDSTAIAKKMLPGQLATTTGRWLAACTEIIEKNDGVINKFLGDGFFAYWPQLKLQREVSQALIQLKDLQEKADPDFRVVLHCGEVTVGGIAARGEESLMGTDVNFVFRLEKLAGSRGDRRLMSAVAQKRLGDTIQTALEGEHSVPGFPEPFPIFSF